MDVPRVSHTGASAQRAGVDRSGLAAAAVPGAAFLMRLTRHERLGDLILRPFSFFCKIAKQHECSLKGLDTLSMQFHCRNQLSGCLWLCGSGTSYFLAVLIIFEMSSLSGF